MSEPTSDLDVAVAAFLEDRADGVPLDEATDRYLAAADAIARARLARGPAPELYASEWTAAAERAGLAR